MGLPKIKYPTYELSVPSSGKVVSFRPFTVSEEKILLTSLQGEDEGEMLKASKSIIETCFMGNVDVEELSSYDIEYMFVMLRSKSVSNVVDMQYKHTDCKEGGEDRPVNVQINLDQVSVQTYNKETEKYEDYIPDTKTGKGVSIQLEDDLGVVMKHPSIDALSGTKTDDEVEMINTLIKSCIKLVYDTEEVYDTFTTDEMDEFYDSLTSKHKEKLYTFMSNIPKLRYESQFKCPSCGYVEPIVFEGFQSFFN